MSEEQQKKNSLNAAAATSADRVLIVEDEENARRGYEALLRKWGYEVLGVASAEDALARFSDFHAAVLIADVELPGMNGLELLGRMKEEYPSVRRVVITAYDEENKKAAEEIGIDAFFAKPIGLDQLKKKVVEVLSASERRVKTIVKTQVLEGTPAAKLLFVLEVLANEQDRLTPYLRECFADPSRSGGRYQVEFAYSINDSLQKLMSFRPDLVLINFDSLYQIPCGQLAARVVESPYRPKEVIVYGLNLEASDKQTMEQLGVQYVDQRRSFAKLVTTVKQTALRHGLKTTV